MKVSKTGHPDGSLEATLTGVEIDAIAASVPKALGDPEFAKIQSIDVYFTAHGAPTGVYRANKKKSNGVAPVLAAEIVAAAVAIAHASVHTFVTATQTVQLAADRHTAAEATAAKAAEADAAK